MPSSLPTTREEILATATIDPEFEAAWKETPFPAGSEYTIEVIKELSAAGLPNLQAALAASRPANITESTHYLTMRDGWKSRTLLCHRTVPGAGARPLIVLLFGGGHCVGHPESELELARNLALELNAVVVLPSYRLAPEYRFPYSVNDSWDCLRAIAREALEPKTSPVLPGDTDAAAGFILGGTSAGCALASVCVHLARDERLSPPLTGQFLCAGSYISPYHVPEKYREFYLSWEQNRGAPVLDADLYRLFRVNFKPDYGSALAFSLDQHHPGDEKGEVKEGHRRLPAAYFQVCGLDMSRDDGLIYERVLREECGVRTRVDLYRGLPHCWWTMFPKLTRTRERMRDAVEGMGWLLEVGKAGKQ